MAQNQLYGSYPQPFDARKMMAEFLQGALTGQAQTQTPQQQSQPADQTPLYHCQPVKNIQEVEQMKWFDPKPFVGLTEDGEYIAIRRWDGSIPAASMEYFKRIKPDELPKPPQPVTHDELAELIPVLIAQSIPTVLKQMGVTLNEPATGGSAVVNKQLLTNTGGRSKGTMGAKSGEAGGDK